MTYLDKVIDIAEGLGWSVKTENLEGHSDVIAISFQRYSNRGRDFEFEVVMPQKVIEKKLKEKIMLYWESFDVDYETYIWLDGDGHGKNGAPYHIREILEDTEDIQNHIEDLAIAI